MSKTIKTILIQEAVENLCLQANLYLSKDVYSAFYKAYVKETNSKAKNVLLQILTNAKLAAEFGKPLCQDTGIVVVFLEIGQDVVLTGEYVEDSINQAVLNCYKQNYFRKSIVNCPYSERKNTKTNTPAIIHTKIVYGDNIKISVAIKGGGSENMSALKMLNPTDEEDRIIDFVVKTVKNAGIKSCPPVRIGIGIGGSFEQSAILSKKALLEKIKTPEALQNLSDDNSKLEYKILQSLNRLNIGPMATGGEFTCYGVNILSRPCHIASMPVAVNINCHSSRHACCVISENKITYNDKDFEYNFEEISDVNLNIKELKLDDISAMRSLKKGDEVYITGTLYTARDVAHKKLVEMIKNKEKLPFDIKNKTIFYAGPCPAKPGEIIGSIGPTTSSRMDKFSPVLYDNGVIATIGKGERNEDVVNAIKKNKALYFSITGGVAVLLSQKIKKAEIIAFPELESEAIYKLEVEKLPVVVEIDTE
ncbi:MAG: fumarate hydratase [Candidatus Gastranaerophilaceae bacterium]|jgi:fumarate hydratase class I